MDKYLFGKLESDGSSSGVPASLENYRVFDSFADFMKSLESKAAWTQPITHRGKIVRKSLDLPEEIVVFSPSLRRFSAQIYPVFGGLLMKEDSWNLLSPYSKEYFKSCPVKLFFSLQDSIEDSYLFLKHTKEINIIDSEKSTLIGATSFSGKFDRVSQLDLPKSTPQIFYVGDVSGFWALETSWVSKNFDGKIEGIKLYDSDEFCGIYNRENFLDRMMKMSQSND